jgi:hypothetical protein
MLRVARWGILVGVCSRKRLNIVRLTDKWRAVETICPNLAGHTGSLDHRGFDIASSRADYHEAEIMQVGTPRHGR